MNDCLESQLVPPYAEDSGQLLLYFFIYGKQMRTLLTAGGRKDFISDIYQTNRKTDTAQATYLRRHAQHLFL